MSSRPTKTLDWATSPSADVIEPSTGYKEAGFVGGDPLIAEYENWKFSQLDAWLDYVNQTQWSASSSAAAALTIAAGAGTITRPSGSFLDDGFGPGQLIVLSGFANAANNDRFTIATVTATVITVTAPGAMVNETGSGDEIVRAYFKLSGPLKVVATGVPEFAVEITGGTTLVQKLEASDDVSITGGDLTVSGKATIGSGASTVAGTLDVGDDVSIDGELHVAGAEVIVDGDLVLGGGLVHGEFTMCVSAAAFQPTAGSPSFSSSPEPTWTAGGADFLYAVVNLPVGSRVKSISFVNTRASGTLTFETYNHDLNAGTVALIGASLAVSGGTSRAVSAVASVSGDGDATLGAGETLYLVAALGASGNKLHGVLITWDRP